MTHPAFVDGVPPSKANARAYLPVFAPDADTVRATDYQGSWLLYVKTLDSWFERDTSDTTSADNGTSVLVGPNGERWIATAGSSAAVDVDAQVDDLASRAAFDDEPEGFSVLVSDVGDGRAAVYSKASNASADWTDPAYFTGPQGEQGEPGADSTVPGPAGISGTSALTRVRVVDTTGLDPATEYEAGDTVDGVTLVQNDLVLRAAPDGESPDISIENGVYVVPASGAASRQSDFDTYDDLPGTGFRVMEGTTNADTLWFCNSDRGGVLGTDPIVIEEFEGGSGGGTAADTTFDDTSAGLGATNVQDALDVIASTLQGTVRIHQIHFEMLAGGETSSSTSDVDSSPAQVVTPKKENSRLIVVFSQNFYVNSNGASDTFIAARTEMHYHDGSSYQELSGANCTSSIGGAASTTIGIRTSVTLMAVLEASARRSDSNVWDFKTMTSGQSGATWLHQNGSVIAVEVDDEVSSPFDGSITALEHYLILGQSLGVGALNTAISTTALNPGQAVMFNAGVRTLGNEQGGDQENTVLTEQNIRSLVNLREQTMGASGETIASAAADNIIDLGGVSANTGVLWSCHAIGGRNYTQLKKGTTPYANSMLAAERVAYWAQITRQDWRTVAASIVHGEANRNDSLATYLGYLEEWQADLTTDVQALFDNTDEVLLFICQMAAWTDYGLTTSDVPLAQLQAALDNPGKIFCVGPKYMLATVDGTHLTAASTRTLGAYHGRAIAQTRQGTPWLPLYCTSAVRTGVNVDLTFHVPEGVLVLDTSLVSNPGDYGFRWIDSTMSAEVSSVSVTGDDTVRLVLNTTPTGANPKVGIADIGTASAEAGPTTGARCCLRDSSTDTYAGVDLHNYACVQRIDVT